MTSHDRQAPETAQPTTEDSEPLTGHRRNRYVALVALLFVVLTIGLPLIGTRTFFASDILLQFPPWKASVPDDFHVTNYLLGDPVDALIPQRAEIRERAYEGDFALWTSRVSGGSALAAIPNSGMLSPLNIAYWVLPLWYAPAVTKLIELAVAMGFTFLFLRQLGISRTAAVLGGVIFAGSGFQVVWANWPHTHVGALIPAAFWAVERGLRYGGIRSALPLAIITGTGLLEGFPAVLGYGLFAAATYAVVRALLLYRRQLPTVARRLSSLLAGVALGFGLAAVQLIPFLDRLGTLNLAYRQQHPGRHLDPMTLVTAAVPNALGSTMHRNFWGAPLHNYVESQSFLGAAALILVSVGVGWGGSKVVRGAKPWLLLSAVTMFILTYLGGPLLDFFQLTPLFSANFVGRLRSVLGFVLACLAALGFEAIVSRRVTEGSRARQVGRAALVGGLIALSVLASWAVYEGARERGQLGYTVKWAVLPMAAAAGTTILAVAVFHSRRWAWRASIVVVPLLVVSESLAFAGPYLPRPPTSTFYPETSVHRFLQEELGHNRFVGEDLALLPNASAVAGLRSITGHVGQPSPWKELLLAVDEAAYVSPTYSRMRVGASAPTSPVLDRLGVTHLVRPPAAPVFGDVSEPPNSSTSVVLSGGLVATAPLPAGRVRAVAVKLTEPVETTEPLTEIRVNVTVGTQRIAAGHRRVSGGDAGTLVVPLTLDKASSARREAEITVHPPSARVVVAGDDVGRPALSVVHGRDDGLRLVHSNGAAVYERLNALPRLRWAGEAMVVADPGARLDALTEGVPPGAVLLNNPGPAGDGTPAEIDILEDSGDRIRARIVTSGAGYFVAADALQHGWRARVDGQPAELHPADHAVVAVHIPSGDHVVELEYRPPGFRVGFALTLASLAILAWMAVRLRLRGSRHGVASGRE